MQAQYESIGGSPIRKWTDEQGLEMCRILDEKRPESAPHKHYIMFRYAHPLTDETLQQMKKDGVTRAVAFSQFPQWSCTTSGSSYNELWRQIKNLDMANDFTWSLIDRWPLHRGFIDSVNDRIVERMKEFDEKTRKKVIIMFSAHSVPMKVVEKGDHYVGEVAASVHAVMQKFGETIASGAIPGLDVANRHVLAWQSKVGFLPWMSPSTGDALKQVGKRGYKHVLVVPIAFTSDHIETLYEIGEEYAEEAEEVGIENFKYTEGLNGLPRFHEALADIVDNHLTSGRPYSPNYKMKCLTCKKPLCRSIVNPHV